MANQPAFMSAARRFFVGCLQHFLLSVCSRPIVVMQRSDWAIESFVDRPIIGRYSCVIFLVGRHKLAKKFFVVVWQLFGRFVLADDMADKNRSSVSPAL